MRTFLFLYMFYMLTCCQIKTDNKQNNGVKTIRFEPEKSSHSGHYLRFIPAEVMYAPSEALQNQAIDYLKTVYLENEIESSLHNNIAFIDAGGNFETVQCNLCNKEIGIEAWGKLIQNWGEINDDDLLIATPCCNKKSSLNDLIYDSPSGFAKYVLEVNDAGYFPAEVDVHQKKIEQLFNTRFRIIWARY